MRLVFSSDGVRPLTSLAEGDRGVIVEVNDGHDGRADRLLSLGITPGSLVAVLQAFPGFVILCDQTELAIERRVGDAVIVRPLETR
jgi:Fe2+ transport system protein FeoA